MFIDLLARLKGTRMSRNVDAIEEMSLSDQKTLSVFVSSSTGLLNYITPLILDTYLALPQNLI